MSAPDLLYNALMGAAVLVSLALLWRFRDARLGFFLGGLCGGLAIVVAIILSGPSMFGIFRLWCWGLFVHGPLWLFGVAGLCWTKSRFAAGGCLAAAGALTTVAVDAFWIEPHWLDVHVTEVPSSRVTTPLRLALIADIQTDRVGEWERTVLRRVMKADPDLILIAGDTLQVPSDQWSEQREAFWHAWTTSGMSAPLGIIAVQGNTDRAQWPSLYRKFGVHAAEQTQTLDLGDLVVTALSERDSFDADLSVDRPDDRFHIVLGHSPDFALGDVDADLLLAGHTHGGQVQLPFIGPLMTLSNVPRDWASGITALPNGIVLVVSRGIGMERHHAPRLRFLCRPQLVIVDLIPA